MFATHLRAAESETNRLRKTTRLVCEQLENRSVPAVTAFAVDTNADTAYDHFDNVNKMAPVDENGMVSLRAVIEYANANRALGDWDVNRYNVNLSTISEQTITLDPNLGALVLESNFYFLGNSVTVERNVAAAAFGLFEVDIEIQTRFSAMTLRGGRTLDSGGAILVNRGATLEVENCTLSNNEAVKDGGAIAANTIGEGIPGAKIFITNSILALNTAERSGGAIATNGALSLTISGSSILGNEATGNPANDEGWGGGIYVVTTDALISGTNIIGNEATGYGGGVYVLDCELTMNGGQLHGNAADFDGGGIYVDAENETVTLTNVSVTQNNAGNKGGGAYVWKGTLAGQLTALTGNTAVGGIPGIGFKQGQAPAPTITVPQGQQTVEAD
ncbi:MAG: hypothetical protein L0241_06520 [Planctomycetia bacterium]|nr:hypothetical protein [Planctomycetia bacterium]